MTLTDAFDDAPTSRTLVVTVQTDEEAYEMGREAIERLARDEPVETPDTFSVPDVKTLFETFTPKTMRLLETIADAEPDSIREAARLVDRDVKNVHQELTQLHRLGLVRFEQDGQAKRPRFPYEEVVISVPFAGGEQADAESITS